MTDNSQAGRSRERLYGHDTCQKDGLILSQPQWRHVAKQKPSWALHVGKTDWMLPERTGAADVGRRCRKELNNAPGSDGLITPR